MGTLPCDAGHAGDSLQEELQAFREKGQIRLARHAGDIAAWPCHAGDQPHSYWLRHAHKDNGNGVRRLCLPGLHGPRAERILGALT